MTFGAAELAAKINGTVLVPGDAGYDECIKRWASNAEKDAAVVVLPIPRLMCLLPYMP